MTSATQAALSELAAALAAVDTTSGRTRRLGAARQVVARHCLVRLAITPAGQPALDAAIKLAVAAPAQSVRRDCAVLLVHALAVPGLVPTGSLGDVCALVEGALRRALLRGAYPFGGSIQIKLQSLAQLHARLDELMEPLEPTFPSHIQGLYAG